MKHQYDLQDPLFRVGNIDVQSVSRPKDYKHSFPHGREKHGFIYVESGALLDVFRGCGIDTLRAEQGELTFIPKGSVYTGKYAAKGTSIKIVQFDLISGELPDYLSVPVKIELPHASELIDAFFRSTEHSAASHPFHTLSCLYELLWRVDEGFGGIPKKFRKLRPALRALDEHWTENEKVPHYAMLCDMSEANFRRLFREYTGMSPVDYRNSIRLLHARNKLLSGEYNVSEAAYESGFTNLSFFTRLYKKKFGHAPKQE